MEEFGSTEFADDEIIAERRITKGFSSSVVARIGIEEELERYFWIFLSVE